MHQRRSTVRHALTVLGVVATTQGCTVPPSPAATPLASEQTVSLTVAQDTSPDVRMGLTNIFFEPFPDSLRSVARLEPDWKELQVVDVVGSRGLRPALLARFRRPGDDSLQYVLDTAGTLDFVGGRQLTFQRSGRLRIADVALRVTALGGAQAIRPYQVLLADDGYTYARIADYRTGEIRAGGRSFAVRLRPRSRGEPFFTLGRGTVVLADVDHDGHISELPSVTAAGRPQSPEELIPGAPFSLGGELLELTGVDSAGTMLRLRRSRRQVAAVEGLRAPELSATLLDGGAYRLSQERARLTLIEFWATDCPYSEKVRAPLNAFATRSSGQPITWLAVVRDRDADSVRHHLATHPMNARVAMADSGAWNEFNPVGVTPLFVLVDEHGVVRHRASGASAVEGVIAAAGDLLSLRGNSRR